MDYFPHYMTLWLAQGPTCGKSNVTAKGVEVMRAHAGATIASVAAALSANLNTAGQAYSNTDEEQSDVLAQQMKFD
jgi:hypothetical protein